MKYDAFISYSHSDCGTIAPAIQKAVENIGKPWYQLKRNLNVFRDETNLGANPHLWENIEKALEGSKNFILLASPKACESDWVTKEIEKWEEKDPSFQKFNIVVTSGEIFWDKISNDFNWEKTTCLPKCLKEKFQSEPLYIDLREYVNKNNRLIDYKLSGFTSEIVKIISAITGIEPREIESDEKKGRNNTILSLTIGVITLVSISLLGYMFYRQKEINERNAIANNLIAEGNKYRETDINKTLLIYAYAYQTNNDIATFKILKSFYDENSVYKSEIYNNETEKNVTITNTLNLFFKKIKAQEFCLNSKDDSIDLEYPKIYMQPKINSYVKIIGNDILVRDFSSYKQKTIHFNKGNIIQTVNDDSKRVLYILSDDNECLVYCLDIMKNKLTPLIKRERIKDTSFFKKIDLSKKYEEPMLKINMVQSNHGNNIILFYDYISEGLNPDWLIYNIDRGNFRNVNPIKNKEWIGYLHSYESIEYFDENNSVFFNIREQNDISGCRSIYFNINKNTYRVIYNGDNYSANIFSQPTVATYFNGLIYGNYSGNILSNLSENSEEAAGDESGFLLQKPLKFSYPITAINSNEKYIFVGTDEGVFHIFENQRDNCVACMGGNHFSIRSVKLENTSKIINITFFNKILYIINSIGEIYELDLNKIIKLKPDPDNIINHLINELGIHDLSDYEKETLKISQKDNSFINKIQKLLTNKN